MLKGWLILIVLPLACLSMHEYFFSFGELQYNNEQQRFEASITVTAHDLENYMEYNGISIPKFEECVNSPLHLDKIEKVLQKGFKIYNGDKNIVLDLLGMEVNTKDQAIFYLSSRKMDKPSSITVEYDLLMDFFDEQQNKLTIFTKSGKEYLTFIKSRTKRTFEY